MNQVTEFIGKNDGHILYAIFALQCCCVLLGFPLILFACSSTEKRLKLKYGQWVFKWVVVCFVGKWMLETYDLVEKQMGKDNKEGGEVNEFNPYKLLHIKDDGSFNTTLIHTEYQRLRAKYNPAAVSDKIPKDKALKRY